MAVSAFDLLDVVKDQIREDARCFNSIEWISPPGRALAATQQPACGTVACIAGWIVLLTRGDVSVEALANCGFGVNAGDIACDILGLTWDEMDGLFEPGTVEDSVNVNHAIARIEVFQRAHERHLRRRQVSPRAAQDALEGIAS